jgi:uracil-DNA glycosylase
MTIEEYFGDWSQIVDLNEADKIIRKLSASSQIICPQVRDVFKAFRLCPFSSLRSVIIGMDPYNNIKGGRPVATGIAFANSPETPEDSYSPSLEILMESVIDYTVPHKVVNFDPSLEKWEEQGVLLLNAALSCQVGRAGSHSLMWRPFMKSLLTNLSRYKTGIVYVLMGNDAISFEPCINKQFNHVIRIRHPSYYARTKTRMPSEVWQEVNNILIGQNGYGIQWYQEY